MLRPRLFGSLILVYVILYKVWEFLGVTGAVSISDITDLQSFKDLFGSVLVLLFGFILISYLVGALGLIRMRTWSAKVVYYAALTDVFIALFLATYFINVVAKGTHVGLGNLTVIAALPVLIITVIPAGIAYVAWNLKKSPEMWQLSERKKAGDYETIRGVESIKQKPVWVQKIFKLIIYTGLVLPAIMAFVVINSSGLQGTLTSVFGFDLFFFILGAVFFSLPYVIFAFIARSVLMTSLEEGGYKPVKRLFVIVGVYIGVTVFIAWNLFTFFQNTEAAAVLVFAPFVTIFGALPGVVVGAVFGFLAYSVWRRSR